MKDMGDLDYNRTEEYMHKGNRDKEKRYIKPHHVSFVISFGICLMILFGISMVCVVASDSIVDFDGAGWLGTVTLKDTQIRWDYAELKNGFNPAHSWYAMGEGSFSGNTNRAKLDNIDKKHSYRFTSPVSKDVVSVYVIPYRPENAPDYTVSLQKDNGGGFPDGNKLAEGTVVGATLSHDEWYSVSLNQPANLLKGSVYHVVMEYKSGTIDSDHFWRGNDMDPWCPWMPGNPGGFDDNVDTPDPMIRSLYYNNAKGWIDNLDHKSLFLISCSDGSRFGQPYKHRYLEVHDNSRSRQYFVVRGQNKVVTELSVPAWVKRGFCSEECFPPADSLDYWIKNSNENTLRSGTLVSPEEADDMWTQHWYADTFAPLELEEGETYIIEFYGGIDAGCEWVIEASDGEFCPDATWNRGDGYVRRSHNGGSSWPLFDGARDIPFKLKLQEVFSGDITAIEKDAEAVGSVGDVWKAIKFEGSIPSGTNLDIAVKSSSGSDFVIVRDNAVSGVTYELPTKAQGRYASWRLVLRTDDPAITPKISNVTFVTVAGIPANETTTDFTAMPTSGQEPLTVTFTDNSTSDDGIEAWEWDFDNNGVVDSTEQNPTHVYEEDGVYTVSLKVYESDGDCDSMTKTDYITMTEVNNAPYTPANPSPSDGATDVPVDAVLSWMGGDSDAEDTITYDVYFGSSISPPRVAENQPGTTYDPGTRDYSAEYYWRIVAKDNHDASNESEVWGFATISKPDDPEWWGYYLGAGEGAWGRTTSEAYTGNYSALLKGVAYEGSDWINIGLIAGKSNGYSGPDAYTAVPSTTYNLSFWMKGDFTRIRVSTITWNTEDGSGGRTRGSTSLGWINPTNTWTKYEGTFTTPADAKKFVVIFRAYGDYTQENLGTIYVDDVNVNIDGGNIIKNPGAENTEDTIPPASISNLQSTPGTTWINWTWTNPEDADFSHTKVYLDGIWQTDTSDMYFNATGLIADTSYEIGTRTEDTTGNVNGTWVNQTTKTLTVPNSPPVADPNNPYIGMEGVPLHFKGNGSYDPDGFIVAYLWTFGDGNTSSGVNPTHIYAQNGTYTVTLTVTDNEGATDTSTTIADIESDLIPPYTTGHSPAKDAIEVAKNTTIVVHVRDDGAGVDIASIVMTVNGIIVTPTITGTPADYMLTYDPSVDFGYGQVVNVTVDAHDLATAP